MFFFSDTHTHTYLRPAVNLSKFVLTVEGDHVLGLPQPVRTVGTSEREGERGGGERGGGERGGGRRENNPLRYIQQEVTGGCPFQDT